MARFFWCAPTQAPYWLVRLTLRMPQLYESSGLLSLASLREHEKKQAQQQAEAARARAESEQRARLEAEREALRAEQERRSAERAALELADAARRSAQLRLEAAQRLESERNSLLARSAEELKVSLNLEREARRNVELVLTAKLLRQRLLTSLGFALGTGAGLATLALYFGVLRPAADRGLATAQESLLAEQRAHATSEVNAARSARRADGLAARVELLEQRLHEASVAQASPRSPQTTAQRPGVRLPPTVTTPQKPCRDDGDPLNPCLRH